MDKIDPFLQARLIAPRTEQARLCFLELSPKGKAAGTWFVALAGWEVCRPDYVLQRSDYPYLVVELVVAGEGVAQLGGKEERIGPGSVLVVSAASPVRIESSRHNPLKKYFICIGGPEAGDRLRSAGLPPDSIQRLLIGSEHRDLVDWMLREGLGGGADAPRICLHLFEILLLKLSASAPRFAPPGNARARLNFERCRALIDSRAADFVSIRDISLAVGLDSASVCRLFRRFQGVSPYQYLLRRKMNLAAAFLIEGRGLVKEAAAYVGMDDPFHFSRLFRRIHGMPPSRLVQK
jgi:AraC-like DNA-binding protein